MGAEVKPVEVSLYGMNIRQIQETLSVFGAVKARILLSRISHYINTDVDEPEPNCPHGQENEKDCPFCYSSKDYRLQL